MITKNTVLILGAGASMPYGFPSGRQLVEDIRDTDIAPDYLAGAGRNVQELGKLREELREADPSSIDGFLEHRKELIPIGKAAIAYALIKYEQPGWLYPDESTFRRNDRLDRGEQWYRQLAERLVTDIDSFHNNKLTIVTFNYDRSLDHYLFQAFLRRWGSGPGKVVDAFRSLPIIHLHGQLGLLPWQTQDSQSTRPYEGGVSGQAVQIAATGIKIISEPDLEDSAEFKQARGFLNAAERVYILGFGYHADNMRRLQLPLIGHRCYDRSRLILGTCYGFTEIEKQFLEDKFQGIEFSDPSRRIVDTLRNCQRFVFDV